MVTSKLRAGDQVRVIGGREKGKEGRVLRLDLEKARLVIEGLNLVKKAVKPTQQNPQGERVRVECAIHASNVMYYDEKAKKGVRKRPDKES